MRNKWLKLISAMFLIFALMLTGAPAARAVSYYSYLQQYLADLQPTLPGPQETNPEPFPPAAGNGTNFWDSITASRKALLAGLLPSAPQLETQPNPSPNPTPTVQDLVPKEQQMLELINKDRVAYGLEPLTVDMELTRLARLKSNDMLVNNYFAHQSPTYGTVFDMFRANGIQFLRGGENLSKAGNVMVSHMRLMNSTNHRANLLTPQFTHVGIGIIDYYPSGVLVTEIFIEKP